MSPLAILTRAVSLLSLIFAIVGGAGILAIMAMINSDVIGRAAFASPVPATAEIVSASIVAIVFLQLPLAIQSGRAIRSDMFIDRVHSRSPRAGNALDFLHHLVGAALFGILVYYLWPELMATITRHRTVGLHGIFVLPRWPFTLCVFIGVVLATLQYILLTMAHAQRALRGERAHE